MKPKKQQITIILPDCVADMPVHIVRGSECKNILVEINHVDESVTDKQIEKPKHAFVWKHRDYAKVALDEIEWLEADGGYTIFHLTGDRKLSVSFNLAEIKKDLPESDFMQIHRSHIVNLKHIKGKTGNCLIINKQLLPIGREFRKLIFSHFLILGERKQTTHSKRDREQA